jgi:uncharacterized protein
VNESLFRRIVRFPLTRLFLSVLFVSTILLGTQIVRRRIGGNRLTGDVSRLLPTLLLITAGYLAYWVYVRVVERRDAPEISLSTLFPQFSLGALLGVFLISATIFFLWVGGIYRVTGKNSWSVLLGFLALSLSSGFLEELYLRGLFFRILSEWLGSWISLAASALLFGFIHMGNPHATVVSSTAIAMEAGVLLAAAYMVSGNLWFPAGIHFAWNFTQGGIFGVAVSGFRATGVLNSELTGPIILSGGGFGAEASIVAVLVCTAAGIFLLFKAKRRGRVQSPFWKRRIAVP